MDREKLFRQQYNRLTVTEREMLLASLEDSRFKLLRFESFENFGMHTDTAVYLCDGREFVFVPGDEVVLGWSDYSEGMDDLTRNDLLEFLEWSGSDDLDADSNVDLDAYLRERMSPVRTVEIPPMLAEREYNEISWHRVDLKSPRLWPYRTEIKWYKKGGGFLKPGKIRVRVIENEVIAELYTAISLNDFIDQVHRDGFSLPTEDEWEYLCGGGSRTLFRWGDSFDFDMNLRALKWDHPMPGTDSSLLPNQFGLFIAYYPYEQEVVEGSQYFLKGGDGGCALCGGYGFVIGYLSCATYYRNESLIKDELGYKRDISSSYSFFRRIVRL